MTTPSTYISLSEDMKNGELHLVPYGAGLALVFSGPQDFIDRWFNWAVNRSVISSVSLLNGWVDGCKRAYVCPKTKDKVLKGLAAQMGWEMVQSREIEVVVKRDPETEEVSHEWDEEKVAEISLQRAREFMETHIKTAGIVMEKPKGMAPIYSLASPGRAESGME